MIALRTNAFPPPIVLLVNKVEGGKELAPGTCTSVVVRAIHVGVVREGRGRSKCVVGAVSNGGQMCVQRRDRGGMCRRRRRSNGVG